MKQLTAVITPALICGVCLYAAWRRVDVFSALTKGAAEGLRLVVRIFPTLVGLLTAVYMLRASGALQALTSLLSPLLQLAGIPPETAGIMLLRPMSGSAALALGAELFRTSGPDSETGRIASVMLGASETTFYTIAVYFGALGVRRTRHAIPAALTADVAAYIGAVLAVKLFF